MPESMNDEVDEQNSLLKVIKSLETWFRRLVAAGVVAFCATLLVAIGLYVYQDDASQQKLDTLETIRDERSIGACRQDNIQTRKTREFAHDQLVQVFSIFSRAQISPEEIIESRKEQFVKYDAFVNESFPYRDCSKECVIAYLTEAPDCPAPEKFPD